MSQIYPPIIEGSLPAFYKENERIKITVPFVMNRAVSPSEVVGMSLKIKTVQTGTYIHEVTTEHTRDFSVSGDSIYATFYVTSDKMRVGQFYKLQIAYIIRSSKDKTTTSQYSSAGVAKFTTKPNLGIQNFEPKVLNTFQSSFIGYYEQEDSTEKVYSYCFDVYGPDKTLYWSTGTQLHNSSTDSSATYSEDTYPLNKEIIAEKVHYIQYSVTTVNGLSVKSSMYKMIRRPSITCGLSVGINPILNFDNGYIDVYLTDIEEAGLVTGAFQLVRASDKTDYADWEVLTRFTLHNEKASTEPIFRDFLIEHGISYRYALQQYNNEGLYSEKIYSESILADFEDSFLFDGMYQLKLRFNTKISKFSSTHLEAKTDTIGGKYPVIFRNGYVNYKEFQIAALVSYYMDEEHLFCPLHKLNTEDVTINYTSENIHKEQIFKNQVLEWLNNGTPKLFRSPQEGMFIVRLIKVSMTPEQKLGRLLHNFSATAYEIAEANYSNFLSYGFITLPSSTVEISQFQQIDLSKQESTWFEWDKENVRSKNLIADYGEIKSLTLTEMIPGDQVTIIYNNGQEENIIIGPFGTYHIESDDGIAELYLQPRVVKVEDLGTYNTKFNDQFDTKYLEDLDVSAEELEAMQSFFKTNAKKKLSSIKYAQGLYFLRDNETGQLRPAKEILGDTAFDTSNIIELNPEEMGYNLYEMVDTMDGKIEFNYHKEFIPTFKYRGNTVTNMTYADCSVAQFIGETNIYKEVTAMAPKYVLEKFYKIVLRPRPIETIYGNPSNEGRIYFDNPSGSINHNGQIITNADMVLSANVKDMNPQAIYYAVQNTSDGAITNRNEYVPIQYWVSSTQTAFDISHRFIINDTAMQIEKETTIILKDFDAIDTLYIDNGLIADVYWQCREYEYECETTDEELLDIKARLDDLEVTDKNYIVSKKTLMADYITRLQQITEGE